MARPRLLVLSQTLPHPADSGAKSRTANLLRQLARSFDVTALCFYRQATLTPAGLDAALAGLADVGRVEGFAIPQEHSHLRLLLDHIRSLTTRRVYTVAAHRAAAFGQRLRECVHHGRFDLVHADSLDLSGWFDEVGSLPLICAHHDVQSLLLARRAAHEGPWARRRYLAVQSRFMLAEERRWCPDVALNTCVSDVDRNEFTRIAPTGRYLVVPNGMDLRHYAPLGTEGGGLLFVGSAGWPPNLDGMTFFLDEIQPLLRSLSPGSALTWVGTVGPHQRDAFVRAGVHLAGHVPDTRPYLREAACCIAPLRMGSGTRIKILEAWAMAKAVVSTSIACEGLAARDGENIIVRDDPAGFADAVARVLSDPELRTRLGAAARRTMEVHYDWDRIGATMNTAYLRLVESR